eukprot:3529125-Amphidinium_carterae.2
MHLFAAVKSSGEAARQPIPAADAAAEVDCAAQDATAAVASAMQGLVCMRANKLSLVPSAMTNLLILSDAISHTAQHSTTVVGLHLVEP